VLLDLETSKETLLPCSGAEAVWASTDTILFRRGEHTLWRFHLRDGREEKLFEIPTAYGPKSESYGDGPILSPSGRLCAWTWATRSDAGVREGTIAIDLERREYRTIGDQTNVFNISVWMP
jgi:hypothetical protein